MESIIDNPRVREWTTQGLFSKRIVIRYLEYKLDEVLVSIAKPLTAMPHKFAAKTILRSKRLSEHGITATCPSDANINSTLLLSKEDVAVCISKIASLWQIRVLTPEKGWSTINTDRFQRRISLILPYIDAVKLETLLIGILNVVEEWHQQYRPMRLEILKLRKLRNIQERSAKAFVEVELRKTSARRYSIEYKADSLEVIVTPCAKVIRFSARYDDFLITLSGLADAINSLDKMWKEVTDLAKSKGISSVGQIVHFSDYKWTKLYD